jgi:hypothetical protein
VVPADTNREGKAMTTTYTIDKEGINGRWRVYWIGDDGYGREQLFDSRFGAEQWVEFMESFE